MSNKPLLQLSAKLYDTPEDRELLAQLQAHVGYLDKSKLIKQLLRAYFAADPTAQATRIVRQVSPEDVRKTPAKRSGKPKQADRPKIKSQSASTLETVRPEPPATRSVEVSQAKPTAKLHKLQSGFDGAEY